MTIELSFGHPRGRAGVYSHQAFQPSGGAVSSKSPFGVYPYRFEIPQYIEDSFMFMNVAHDLDRADNEEMVVKGNH